MNAPKLNIDIAPQFQNMFLSERTLGPFINDVTQKGGGRKPKCDTRAQGLEHKGVI